jgi:uncharacterized protein YndB with AHSA1/START domain
VGHAYEEHGEFEVPASPEEVWDAIATGPGLDSWFMGRNEVVPGEGGSIRTDLGDFAQDFAVTGWEPARRLAFRSATRDDGTFLALEWLVEGRGGGSTVVRTVASGFLGAEDWAEEYEAMTAGGAMYTHTLVQYLTHFRGRAGHPAFARAPMPGGRAALWATLRERFGLAGTPTVGDLVRLDAAGLDLGGATAVVDYVTPRFLGLRSRAGLHRFFGDEVACAEHRLFGDDAAAVAAAWERWFPAAFG